MVDGVAINSRQGILKLVDFDLAISVHVECFEYVLHILLRHQFFVVDCGCQELLEVNLAVSVEVDLPKDIHQGAFELPHLLHDQFELFFVQSAIVVLVQILECDLQLFNVLFVRL